MSKAIIFDFDGTLVDSEQAIYQCFQTITNKLAPDRIDNARSILIGPPLRDTASKILGRSRQDQLNQFVKLFIQMHDDQAIFQTQPYPGVDKILQKLSLMQIPIAIATNKRQAPTIKLIDHFGWSKYFKFVECSDRQHKERDKDKMIKDIKSSSNRFKNAYFVGDTVNDGFSANLNNLRFIKVNYGYGQEQDWSSVKIFKEIERINDLV